MILLYLCHISKRKKWRLNPIGRLELKENNKVNSAYHILEMASIYFM